MGLGRGLPHLGPMPYGLPPLVAAPLDAAAVDAAVERKTLTPEQAAALRDIDEALREFSALESEMLFLGDVLFQCGCVDANLITKM